MIQLLTGLYEHKNNLKTWSIIPHPQFGRGRGLQGCSCTRFNFTLATSGSVQPLGLQYNPETDGQLRILFPGVAQDCLAMADTRSVFFPKKYPGKCLKCHNSCAPVPAAWGQPGDSLEPPALLSPTSPDSPCHLLSTDSALGIDSIKLLSLTILSSGD